MQQHYSLDSPGLLIRRTCCWWVLLCGRMRKDFWKASNKRATRGEATCRCRWTSRGGAARWNKASRGKEYKPGYQLHYCRAIIIVYSSTHRFAHHGLFPGPSCDKPLAEACRDETLVLGPRGSLSGVFYFGMRSSTLDHIWALLDAGISSVDGRPRV